MALGLIGWRIGAISSANARARLEASQISRTQDAFYGHAQRIERIVENANNNKIQEAIEELLDLQDTLSLWKHEHFSTIEWKTFYSETLDRLRNVDAQMQVAFPKEHRIAGKHREIEKQRLQNTAIDAGRKNKKLAMAILFITICITILLYLWIVSLIR